MHHYQDYTKKSFQSKPTDQSSDYLGSNLLSHDHHLLQHSVYVNNAAWTTSKETFRLSLQTHKTAINNSHCLDPKLSFLQEYKDVITGIAVLLG